MNDEARAPLLEALSQKKELIERFLALTIEQTDILKREDVSMEAFSANLRERQTIIAEVEKISRRVNTLLEPWLFAEGAGPKEDAFVRLQEEIQKTLDRVYEIDRLNQEKAKRWMEHYGALLKKSRASRRTIGAYQQSAVAVASDESYIDKRQ